MFWKRRSRGFSLIELGIVLAVIAVLSSIVIYGAGYFRAANQRMAVELVLTLKKAAGQYALRHTKGLSYGVSANQNDPTNVTLKGLRGEGFLPTQVATPWGSTDIVLTPHDAPGLCAGFTCLKIDLPVPPEECASGDQSALVLALLDRAIPNGVTCSNTLLTVIVR